jgi:hypothetical protein
LSPASPGIVRAYTDGSVFGNAQVCFAVIFADHTGTRLNNLPGRKSCAFRSASLA